MGRSVVSISSNNSLPSRARLELCRCFHVRLSCHVSDACHTCDALRCPHACSTIFCMGRRLPRTLDDGSNSAHFFTQTYNIHMYRYIDIQIQVLIYISTSRDLRIDARQTSSLVLLTLMMATPPVLFFKRSVSKYLFYMKPHRAEV